MVRPKGQFTKDAGWVAVVTQSRSFRRRLARNSTNNFVLTGDVSVAA
jgi:hypothetical protein